MPNKNLTRATLSRLPGYLEYLRTCVEEDTVSAAKIARALGYGEVLVRRDLNIACKDGRPKIGFPTKVLIYDIEKILGIHDLLPVVIVGVGKLGSALLEYKGFEQYGFSVLAGFDSDENKTIRNDPTHPVYHISRLTNYCKKNNIRIGIIAVPKNVAQKVCNMMVRSGITEIWNFAPCELSVNPEITIKNEQLALSLAQLHYCAKKTKPV